MDAIIKVLYPIISFGVWIIAAIGLGEMIKPLQKKKRIFAIIALAACFFMWLEGVNINDNTRYENGYQQGYEAGVEDTKADYDWM